MTDFSNPPKTENEALEACMMLYLKILTNFTVSHIPNGL